MQNLKRQRSLCAGDLLSNSAETGNDD